VTSADLLTLVTGNVVVCGRLKDVIMAGRNIHPADIERAACRVAGVRPGCSVAVRLDARHSRETFAVAVAEGHCVVSAN
jgi:fatty-acyl-CoA synthase